MGPQKLLAAPHRGIRGLTDRTGKPAVRREDGVVALEFMLVFPFFIYLVLLLVDLGVLSFEYITAANSVREGARYGAVNCGSGACTVDAIKTRVVDVSGGLIADGDLTVTWEDVNGDGYNSGRGDSVVVSVDHTYDFLFFPASISVLSCADMRLELRDGTADLPSGGGC